MPLIVVVSKIQNKLPSLLECPLPLSCSYLSDQEKHHNVVQFHIEHCKEYNPRLNDNLYCTNTQPMAAILAISLEFLEQHILNISLDID